MHFLFVASINAYKCHIINFLLTSLLLGIYWEISDLGLFVKTSPYGLGLYKKDLGLIQPSAQGYYLQGRSEGVLGGGGGGGGGVVNPQLF
jgi:hypothetical protein